MPLIHWRFGLQLLQQFRDLGLEHLLPLRGEEAVAVFLRVADVFQLFGRRRVVDVAVRVAGDERELVRATPA